MIVYIFLEIENKYKDILLLLRATNNTNAETVG